MAMNTVREIAKAIVAEMRTVQEECTPAAAKHYERLSIITYADFLKRSPERTEAMNTQCLEESWLYAQKAISYGASEEKIEESFARLRAYWIPRLKEATNAEDHQFRL
jgi:hypothetical protein